MSTIPDGASARLIGAAVGVVAVAAVSVVLVGRRLRQSMGLGSAKRSPTPLTFTPVPPSLVKRALERGLVTSAQLARMSEAERQFALASLRGQLEADEGTASRTPPRSL